MSCSSLWLWPEDEAFILCVRTREARARRCARAHANTPRLRLGGRAVEHCVNEVHLWEEGRLARTDPVV